MPPKRQASPSDHSSKRAKLVPWTIQDKIILEATTPAEITLWERFDRRFKTSPLNVLEGLTIESIHEKKLKDHTGKLTIDNTNWSKTFCEKLSHLVCVPFFQDRPGLLRYAIEKAVFLRTRQMKPSPKSITPSRNQDFVDYILQHIEGLENEDGVPAFLNTTTIKFFGNGSPRYSKFLSHLDHASVGRIGRADPSSKVSAADISNIIEAWDMYAGLREDKEELKTVEEYYQWQMPFVMGHQRMKFSG
ncbi:hypothetical protein L207DRAFT_572646 [Hyaloscypha variabilis F]|uniref:Uncharacterized protein n=1 Tax=Hyaloscypha variabilis (strain UAMH 11265 / GT02V1 / F) TaxID=1149755 RepID=A0A2J6R071_HYAVF|nr:hypothetical protein L207DRAFT_572646 [Hyaloscypha variabilis F]